MGCRTSNPISAYRGDQIARLAFIRVTFVPHGTAEWLARVDRVRWTLAIGDWRLCPSKATIPPQIMTCLFNSLGSRSLIFLPFWNSQKGSPGRCRFRFFPFSSVFLPFFSVFFVFLRFLLFFSFLAVFFSVPTFFHFSVFFRFFFPFSSISFSHQKKTGRHRSRDPFCETPTSLFGIPSFPFCKEFLAVLLVFPFFFQGF